MPHPLPPAATTVMADPPNVTVSEGDTATLSCLATGDPAPVVTWLRGGATVPDAGTPRYHISPNSSSLLITAVEEGDGGVFVCRATNPGGVQEANVSLTVYSTCGALGQAQDA